MVDLVQLVWGLAALLGLGLAFLFLALFSDDDVKD